MHDKEMGIQNRLLKLLLQTLLSCDIRIMYVRSRSSLLMHACSAEGGRVAVSFFQVRKGLFVKLHGIFGKTALYLLTSQMKPAVQAHQGTGLAEDQIFLM